METYIAALDQGTTTSRAILFNSRGEIVSKAQYPFRQIFPQPGWVEHDPMEIWATTVRALSEAVDAAHIDPKAIAGVGITNQRETAILWDRRTGQPVYNAIVWQCRRTAEICDRLKADGLGETVTEKTGLLIDAYFSGTKLKWIMDNIPGVRQRAERGELCAGTVDSWLIWNLTGGKAHVTDYSNASRTMLFNIHTLQWDPALCAALDIPMDLLPEPKSNSEVYGHLASGLPGLEDLAGIPVCGSAGDQQSALFGQACFTPGQAKNTYGTGCFMLLHTGHEARTSSHNLVTTVAASSPEAAAAGLEYALEGSVFVAGALIQWLRDELGIIGSAAETEALAKSIPDTGGVYIVPAFTGLGAPWWEPDARGAIFGLTRGTGRAQIARAALEALAYQVSDLATAMADDAGGALGVLNVDGGASANNFLMQFQADLLGCELRRPQNLETTSLGAAYLAGLATGFWSGTDELLGLRAGDEVFSRERDGAWAEARLSGWHDAVRRAIG